MIEVSSTRTKGSEKFDLGHHTSNLFSALQSLCKFELGFGGKITEHSETHITVRTCVFNCVDITCFSGSKEEIEYLLTAAGLYVSLQSKFKDTDIDAAIKNSNGNALLLTAAGGGLAEILIGKRYSEVAVTMSLTKDVRYTKKLLAFFNGDSLYNVLEKYFKKYLSKFDVQQTFNVAANEI